MAKTQGASPGLGVIRDEGGSVIAFEVPGTEPVAEAFVPLSSRVSYGVDLLDPGRLRYLAILADEPAEIDYDEPSYGEPTRKIVEMLLGADAVRALDDPTISNVTPPSAALTLQRAIGRLAVLSWIDRVSPRSIPPRVLAFERAGALVRHPGMRELLGDRLVSDVIEAAPLVAALSQADLPQYHVAMVEDLTVASAEFGDDRHGEQLEDLVTALVADLQAWSDSQKGPLQSLGADRRRQPSYLDGAGTPEQAWYSVDWEDVPNDILAPQEGTVAAAVDTDGLLSIRVKAASVGHTSDLVAHIIDSAGRLVTTVSLEKPEGSEDFEGRLRLLTPIALQSCDVQIRSALTHAAVSSEARKRRLARRTIFRAHECERRALAAPSDDDQPDLFRTAATYWQRCAAVFQELDEGALRRTVLARADLMHDLAEGAAVTIEKRSLLTDPYLFDLDLPGGQPTDWAGS